MNYLIPSKTFFIGEYAALNHGPAILLTTYPCFEMSTQKNQKNQIFLEEKSPGHRWWSQLKTKEELLYWLDPYHGLGGMGASSAQFIGAYLLSFDFKSKDFSLESLMMAYQEFAWSGLGVPPSGYDLLAQIFNQCVYIHRDKKIYEGFGWPFKDLSFFLIHTGSKLATHQHLASLSPMDSNELLFSLVEKAKQAFILSDRFLLIEAINDYHQVLLKRSLVAEHSLIFIEAFQKNPDVLAIKGCGAMGSDLLLLLVDKTKKALIQENLLAQSWKIIATEKDLYTGSPLIAMSQ